MQLTPAQIKSITQTIQTALTEDIGAGDATSNSIIPAERIMGGQIIAKQSGVVAGLDVAEIAFRLIDPNVEYNTHANEGASVNPRDILATVRGKGRAMLTAERTAINFLGRMSGIASLTAEFVAAVNGTPATILDTRKTAPGLRLVDKLAVKRGGGANHRMGLYDMILIKDNHIDEAGSISEAVRLARSAHTDLPIEVETRTLDDVAEALSLNVERILLDNMSAETMREAVSMSGGKAKMEASGNMSLETVRAAAETGVDFISVGALTHSAKVFDVSFLWTK